MTAFLNYCMKLFSCVMLVLVCALGYSQDRKKPLFISFEGGIGSGGSEFDYLVDKQAPGNELSNITKREYSTKFLRSRFSVSLGYKYKKLGFGAVGVIGTQKNNEVVSIVTKESGSVFFEDGFENWPQGKSYLGMFIDYDFKLTDDIMITPRFDILKYQMSNDQTLVGEGIHVNNTFSYNEIFTDRNAIGISARLKFFAKDGHYFFVGFNYLRDSFGLSKEYIKEEFSSFNSKQSQTNIAVGYQFSL